MCGFLSQGPLSRYFYGSHALLASTSLSTRSNDAASASAAPLAKQRNTPSKETGGKTEYSVRLQVDAGAVWGIGGLIVCGVGVWLAAPQMARLGNDGIIGCIALVIGALGIYKGDMNKLETKIENVETNLNSKIDKVETSLKGRGAPELSLFRT